VPSPPLVTTAPPTVHHPLTRSRSGIFKRKERADGTVAWLVACMTNIQDDPTFEPRNY
jgi:hypothetical protein